MQKTKSQKRKRVIAKNEPVLLLDKNHIESEKGVAFNICGNFPLVHTHNYWELIVFHTPCTHTVNGKAFEIKKPSLVLVLPEDVHCITNATWVFTQSNFKITDTTMRKLCALLDESLYDKIRNTSEAERLIELSQDSANDVLSMAYTINAYLTNQTEPVFISYIVSLLGKYYIKGLSSSIFNDATLPPIIREVLNWMNNPNNFQKPLSSLTEECGYSRMQLTRFFKQHCKTTMRETFTIVKLRYAQNLLKSTEEKIITIANIIGYQTQSQFDSVFKSAYGITPKDFRKQYLQSIHLEPFL